jgi:hypothetical protein
VTTLKFIEFSSKGTTIFVSGGQEGLEDSASVAAVKFSSNIKLTNEFKIKGAGEMVYSLKRHENGNILFVGARSKVVILFFDGLKFETIAEYSNLPLTSITHLQSLDEELYCVSPEGSIMLKLIYANRGVVIENKEKPKVEKNTILQFGVSTKKVSPLSHKASWMKLDSTKNNMLIKSMGKLNILAKEEGKTNFKFSSSMRDTGTLILNIRHSIPGSPKASRRQIYLYFATQQHSKALEQRYGRDHRGHREGHTELPS